MAYLTFLESQEKTAVFTYGRNNPPTVGHEKLFDKTMEVAKKHGSTAHIVTSHSQDNNKNPLSAEHKVKLIKHAYPEARVSSSSKEAPSLMHIAKKFHEQGHKHLVMVAGSDRVKEYHTLLHKYNNKPDHYSFKSIKVVSAGHRDPDAEGAAGMSGTKLRAHAAAGHMEKFKSGLMSKLSDKHKEEVYHNVRKAMKVGEIYDPHLKISKYQWGEPEGTQHMKKMTPGQGAKSMDKRQKSIREQYVAGLIFKLGEMVTTKEGEKAKVIFRGSNYLTLEHTDGKVAKRWLEDIVDHVAMSSSAQGVYAVMSGKLREKKLPALLLPRFVEQVEGQLEFDGIQTKNLDMCADAFKQFKKMIETVRAGKHIGEPAGHEPDKLPAKGAEPEQALRPDEILNNVLKQQSEVSPSTVQNQVQAGIAMKPTRLKHMQFRQYVGL